MNPFDDDSSNAIATIEDSHAPMMAVDAHEAGADLAPLVAMARNVHRDEKTMLGRAKWLGSLMGDRAYYDFPTGGQRIIGPSIMLAEALAGEWGAIAHEMTIVSAQPLSSGGQRVHLRARVIDLKRIVIGQADSIITTSPPPGKFRSKPDQVERWHSMQIQSAGSKVKRNALLDVMPAWFVDAAMRSALDTNATQILRRNGKMRSVPEAAEDTIKAFAGRDFSRGDLEQFVGRSVDLWTVAELQTLRDLWGDLDNGRATKASALSDTAPAVKPQAAPKPTAIPENPPTPDFQVEVEKAAAKERVRVDAGAGRQEGGQSAADIKRACADLEAKIGDANVALLRDDTHAAPPAGQDVRTWGANAERAKQYLAALEATAAGY